MVDANLESCLDDLPKLLTLVVTWILNLDASSLGDDLFSSEWPFGMSPSRIIPPVFHSFNFHLEQLVLLVG